jgi:hypothetical protein
MAKKKTSKSEKASIKQWKSKLKKFCVTETIYVTLDVFAKNEDEAKQILENCKLDQYDYQHLIDQANTSIEVQQYE